MLDCLFDTCQVTVSLDGEILAQVPVWTLLVFLLG
jgi:hypothetical protein